MSRPRFKRLNISIVQVLDQAVVQVQKSKPFRMLIVLVSALGALALQGFYILTREMNLNVKSI